jgi:hypothetical protein
MNSRRRPTVHGLLWNATLSLDILRYIHEEPLRDAIQLQLNRG